MTRPRASQLRLVWVPWLVAAFASGASLARADDFTPVVGSILAITVSMNYGFTTTLFVGVGAYLLGLVALPKTS